jgi:outer membrane protein OmpA-like peptidoglycan-associated protein
MNDNPDIFIELGSHTDDRAPDDYNMDLSWRRARSAVDYMIFQGIAKERITARGYGESALIIKDAVTEEEHQVNRRTEFKVLRYNPRERSDDLPPEELDEYERFFQDSGDRGF